MKHLINTFAAGAVLLSAAFGAEAGLVHTDVHTSGDQGATLHEETGLEWIKLSATNNMSIDDVAAELNGGQFDGWRFPTSDELTTYMQVPFEGAIDISKVNRYTSFSYNPNSTTSPTKATTDAAEAWKEYMGVSKENGATLWSYGFHADEDGLVDLNGIYINGTTGNIFTDFDHSAYSTAYKSDGQSVFLVSDGGVTMSSKLDPSLNASNPNSPYQLNNVSAPLAGAGVLMLVGMAAYRRR